MMVDRSKCIGGRAADAILGDLSDGRTGADADGLRHGELERVGAVPAIWGMPGHVLRMAWAARRRRAGMGQGPVARAAALSARDIGGGGGRGCRGAPALSASSAEEAPAVGCAPPGPA